MIDAQQKKRRKGLIWGSCAVAGVAVLGGIAYTQYVKIVLAKQAYYRLHDVRYGIKIYNATSETQANAAREKFRTQALTLRDKWKLWAEQHRDLLTQMRHAQASDLKMLQRVYNTLPNRVGYAGAHGITQDDLNDSAIPLPSNSPLPSSNQERNRQIMHRLRWAYLGFKPPAQHFDDPITAANYEKSMRSGDKLLQNNFAQNRDFALLRSMGASRSHLIVWASGRITESTMRLHSSAYDDTEIAPTYDFLR